MDRVSRGSGFGGAVRYVFANFNASFLCSSNVLAARDERRAISKMGMLAHRLRPDIKKPVWHQALRLPRGEEISHDRFREIAHDYMVRMGWNTNMNQYVAIVSDDPKGQHIHIVANRVGIDGSVFHGQNENLISTRVCQELERAYGLTLTKGPEYILDERGVPRAVYSPPREKKIRKGEHRLAERLAATGKTKPLPRKAIQRALRSALSAGQTDGLGAFLAAAESGGIRVLANVGSTGRVNGLSFEADGIAFKASDIGDDFRWAALKEVVGFTTSDLPLLEARSLRHVMPDQLPSLSQPASSARELRAPPAAKVGFEPPMPVTERQSADCVPEPLKQDPGVGIGLPRIPSAGGPSGGTRPSQVEADRTHTDRVDKSAPYIPPLSAEAAGLVGLAKKRRAGDESDLERDMRKAAKRATEVLSLLMGEAVPIATTSKENLANFVLRTYYERRYQPLPHPHRRSGGRPGLSALETSGRSTLGRIPTLNRLRTLPKSAVVLDPGHQRSPGLGAGPLAGVLHGHAPAHVGARRGASHDGLRRFPAVARTDCVGSVAPPTLGAGLLRPTAAPSNVSVAPAPIPTLYERDLAKLEQLADRIGRGEAYERAKAELDDRHHPGRRQAQQLHDAELGRRMQVIVDAGERRAELLGTGDDLYLRAASDYLASERAAGREPTQADWRAWDRSVGAGVITRAHIPLATGPALNRLSPAAVRNVDTLQRQVVAGGPHETTIQDYGVNTLAQWRATKVQADETTSPAHHAFGPNRRPH